MYYRKIATFILFIFLFSMFVFPISVQSSDTQVILSSTLDGQGFSEDFVDYGKARNATTGVMSPNSEAVTLGQYQILASEYAVYRTFLFFETFLDTDTHKANITDATLSIYIKSDYSATDFNITVQSGMPDYPHSPLKSEDHYYINYEGDGGYLSTSGMGQGRKNITLNTQGIGWILTDDSTKLCLRSSRDINYQIPTTDETVEIYMREKGESEAPKLYLTYDLILKEDEPPASSGESGDGAKETTFPKITVPEFHIPIWGYYLILGSICIVVITSMFSKAPRSKHGPNGVKIQKSQKRLPKRNRKGRFTK